IGTYEVFMGLQQVVRYSEKLLGGDQRRRSARREKVFWSQQPHRRDAASRERRESKTMMRPTKNLLLAALLGTALLFGPAPTRAQTLHLPAHEKFVMKNGLTVLLLEKRGVPMVNVFALVKTGSAA